MKKVIFSAILVFSLTTANFMTADAASGVYKSCKTFNSTYKHGVAKSASTKDKVKSRKTGKVTYKKPASGTKISASIYNKAMKNNHDLDRDKDGIACER